jgi:nitroimidazol reductase NimA-like FMN-containing flavoprotein (pyridoxamine 5'-phosphate oxidase superfamily)
MIDVKTAEFIYKRAEIAENRSMTKIATEEGRKKIRLLLRTQKLGVLATMESRHPYQSLVAFAVSDDLKHIYFATAVETRKYVNLTRHSEVSMLFDDRSNSPIDFRQGIAVTAIGSAKEVTPRSKAKILDLYLKRHPGLEGFAKSPSCRLFQIKVRTFILVTEFQRVTEVRPG